MQILHDGLSLRRAVFGAGVEELFPGRASSQRLWEEKRGVGVATKCDFCIDRRAEGREAACVQSCPGKARVFGDLDDTESEISYLIKTKRGFVLRPEVGTEPKVYYLPPR
jgi:molybdopterin-containing oxidoreductase family iron-sulfur binding subunit